MTRSTAMAVIGGLLGMSVALLRFMPAAWLQPWIAQATEQRVQWINTSGSIWDGQTQWRLTGGQGAQDQQNLPGVWRWHLRPTWQQGPALALQVEANCCLSQALQLQAAWTGGRTARWRLDDVSLVLPLQVLRGLGTPWNTLQLEGRLAVHTQELQAGEAQQVRGQVRVDIADVASRLSTVRPLGDYQATVQWPAQALPQVKLQTLSGHLKLEGQGQIAQGRLRFRGQASASPDSEAALANLLNIIGRRNGSVSVLTIG